MLETCLCSRVAVCVADVCTMLSYVLYSKLLKRGLYRRVL